MHGLRCGSAHSSPHIHSGQFRVISSTWISKVVSLLLLHVFRRCGDNIPRLALAAAFLPCLWCPSRVISPCMFSPEFLLPVILPSPLLAFREYPCQLFFFPSCFSHEVKLLSIFTLIVSILSSDFPLSLTFPISSPSVYLCMYL